MQQTNFQPLVGFAIQVAGVVRPVIERVEQSDKALGDQIRRAMSSVVLNLAEAFGNTAGQRRNRFSTARGSLSETRAAIQLAVAWGYVDSERAASAEAQLDQLGARIHGAARK